MDYRFGIEEEFFVVCDRSGRIEAEADEIFLERAEQLSDGRVERELLQSQVEAATSVCRDFETARSELNLIRSALAVAGAETGRSVIAAGTHPTARWAMQRSSDKLRYHAVVAELQMLAQRNLVCGLHVHVEVHDPELQISVMRRALPYLPILLALSTSSPFWQGRRTGFASYRLTSYDEMPRTGLPPLFWSRAEYTNYVGMLQDAGFIEDPSYIWWAIRPSSKYPTLELRIADACTSLDDALAIAAVFRCLVRHLVEDRTLNAGITSPGRAIVEENKWRVQRFGLKAELINPFGGSISITAEDAARRLVAMLEPDAARLDCSRELARARQILSEGTSADTQLSVYEHAIADGAGEDEALQCVLAWLQKETHAGRKCPQSQRTPAE